MTTEELIRSQDAHILRLEGANAELRSQLTAATTERDKWESRTHTAAWESVELKRRAEAAEQALAADRRFHDREASTEYTALSAALLTAEQALQRVTKLCDDLATEERHSMLAQGESPRPADWSEGHYTGFRAGIRSAIERLRAALGAVDTPTDDGLSNWYEAMHTPTGDPAFTNDSLIATAASVRAKFREIKPFVDAGGIGLHLSETVCPRCNGSGCASNIQGEDLGECRTCNGIGLAGAVDTTPAEPAETT